MDNLIVPNEIVKRQEDLDKYNLDKLIFTANRELLIKTYKMSNIHVSTIGDIEIFRTPSGKLHGILKVPAIKNYITRFHTYTLVQTKDLDRINIKTDKSKTVIKWLKDKLVIYVLTNQSNQLNICLYKE